MNNFEKLRKEHNRRFRNTIFKMFGGMLVLLILIASSCSYVVKSNGGLDQMIIDAGKEFKDIKHEIDQHQPTDE